MLRLLAASLVLAMSVHAPPAQADEYYEFVHPICAPEIGYFRVQRVGVYNPPWGGPYISDRLEPRQSAVKSLREKAALFTAKELNTQPYICRIPGNINGEDPGKWRPKIDVALKVSSYPRIDVVINGQKIDEMILGGDRVLEEIDSISIVHGGVELKATTCVEKELPGPERIVCTTKALQEAEMEKAKQASIDAARK